MQQPFWEWLSSLSNPSVRGRQLLLGGFLPVAYLKTFFTGSLRKQAHSWIIANNDRASACWYDNVHRGHSIGVIPKRHIMGHWLNYMCGVATNKAAQKSHKDHEMFCIKWWNLMPFQMRNLIWSGMQIAIAWWMSLTFIQGHLKLHYLIGHVQYIFICQLSTSLILDLSLFPRSIILAFF